MINMKESFTEVLKTFGCFTSYRTLMALLEMKNSNYLFVHGEMPCGVLRRVSRITYTIKNNPIPARHL